jgi:hypothetical protein
VKDISETKPRRINEGTANDMSKGKCSSRGTGRRCDALQSQARAAESEDGGRVSGNYKRRWQMPHYRGPAVNHVAKRFDITVHLFGAGNLVQRALQFPLAPATTSLQSFGEETWDNSK